MMKKHGALAIGMAWVLSCAGAQQVPARKPGLWEVALAGVEQGTPQAPATVQQCVDRANDAQILLSIAPGQENCGVSAVRRQGQRYQVSNRCSVHGQRVDMQMELSGDFQQRYEGSYLVRFAGKVQPESRRFEARWLGACRSGMQPGDMALPNGIVVNVLKPPHTHADGHGHAHD